MKANRASVPAGPGGMRHQSEINCVLVIASAAKQSIFLCWATWIASLRSQ